MSETTLPDGLEALRKELSLSDIMTLIEKTAKWIHPDTFRYLPIWYPEHCRRGLFYKSNWSAPQLNTNRQTGISEHKQEGNIHANKALTLGLGLRSGERTNWSCCHIWSVDDGLYQEANLIVQDPRYYSCVANMILLPTPLKAFTDVMTEVKLLLRICAGRLYNWSCEHDLAALGRSNIDSWTDWTVYPSSWPQALGDNRLPPGTAPFDQRVRAAAVRRLERIRYDLENAGPHYPRDQVRSVLQYWNVDINATP